MPCGKVLVVDDYEPNAKGMRDLLEASGYSVRVAFNGNEGLRMASEDPPDLMLLDVKRPGPDGTRLLTSA